MSSFRALVLGGSGVFGQHALLALSSMPQCEGILCVGRDPIRLAHTREMFGDRVTTVAADMRELDRLSELASGCDVVINAAGPSSRLAVHACAIALKAERPYADLCDDDSGFRQLATYDAEAKARGVTVVAGAGCSGGITNIAAQELYGRFDSVERMDVFHGAPPGESLGGLANLEHLLDLVAGPIPVLKEGCLASEVPFAFRQRYDFGGDVGVIPCATISHPEPVMFLRELPGVRESRVWLGLLPEEQMVTLEVLSRLGLAGEGVVCVGGADVSVREVVARHLLKESGTESDPRTSDGPRFAVHVVAEGWLNGRKCTKALSTYQGAGRMTGAPLALMARLLAERVVSLPGVHTAGRAVTDRAAFRSGLKALGADLLIEPVES